MSWVEELRRREAMEYGREDMAELKAILIKRNARYHLETARRLLGGTLFTKEKAIPEPLGSVSYLVLGLARISRGKTIHHEGGGYTYQVFGTDPQQRGQVQPFSFDQTPIDISLVGVGVARHRKIGDPSDPEEVFVVAKGGTLILKEDRLRPTPREIYRATLTKGSRPPGPKFSLSEAGNGGILIESHLFSPPVTDSGQIDLNAIDFFTGRTGNFQPTNDPSADCLRIEGLVMAAIQAVRSSQ